MNLSTRKFHSYPTLQCLAKEASRVNMLNSKIYMLPEEIVETIFKLFSYEEIVLFREVCHWFYFIAGSILNKKFLALTDDIEKKIQETRTLLPGSNAHGYLKILYILKSEVSVLEACCLEYVVSNMFYFSGGTILDLIESILRRNSSKDSTECISKLLIVIDDFLDYFDFTIEPLLLKKSVHLPLSWFGKKMVDLLECSLTFEKNIKIHSEDGSCCQLEGFYIAEEMYSMKKPPFISGSAFSFLHMFTFIKYIRDQIRWNNVLCLQLNDVLAAYPKERVSFKDSFVSIRKEVNLNFAKTYHKKLVVTLSLHCLRTLAPMVCQKHLSRNRTFGSWESLKVRPDDYEFSTLLEIGYMEMEQNEAVPKVCLINITQLGNKCSYTSETKDNGFLDE